MAQAGDVHTHSRSIKIAIKSKEEIEHRESSSSITLLLDHFCCRHHSLLIGKVVKLRYVLIWKKIFEYVSIGQKNETIKCMNISNKWCIIFQYFLGALKTKEMVICQLF